MLRLLDQGPHFRTTAVHNLDPVPYGCMVALQTILLHFTFYNGVFCCFEKRRDNKSAGKHLFALNMKHISQDL